MVHGQLLRLGERMFGDPENQVQYFLLRADPSAPTCEANPDIDALVAKQLADSEGAPKSDLDLLFGDVAIDPNEIRASLEAARDQCRERFAVYERVSKAITPEVEVFREIETGFFGIFKFGTENRPLILLIMVAIAPFQPPSISTTSTCVHPARRKISRFIRWPCWAQTF